MCSWWVLLFNDICKKIRFKGLHKHEAGKGWNQRGGAKQGNESSKEQAGIQTPNNQAGTGNKVQVTGMKQQSNSDNGSETVRVVSGRWSAGGEMGGEAQVSGRIWDKGEKSLRASGGQLKNNSAEWARIEHNRGRNRNALTFLTRSVWICTNEFESWDK